MIKYYISIDTDGRVLKHHSFIPKSADPSEWLEIDMDPDTIINTAGPYAYYYDTTTEELSKVSKDTIPEYIAQDIKKAKEQAVAEIIVTTSTGKVFDGDETSQDRMLRAISIAAISGETTTDWKLADNTKTKVTLEELQEALTLAGQEMSHIWLGS